MAISTCAIAVRSHDKAAVLEALRYRDTGKHCPGERLPLSRGRKQVMAVLPDGWIYLLGDFWRLDERRLKAASRLGLVVTCSLVTTVDASQARAFDAGAELWFVDRDPDSYSPYDPHQLEVRGEPPPILQTLRDRYFPIVGDPGAEDEEGEIFDLPLELAKSICGYSPVCWLDPACEAITFSYLERTAAPKPTTPFHHRLATAVRMAWGAISEARKA